MAKLALNGWKCVLGFFILGILLKALLFKHTSKYMNFFHTTAAKTGKTELSGQRVAYDVIDPRDARFHYILLEEEALKIKPCTDEKLAASVQHSSLSFTDRDKKYNIGDEVHALITLKNGYNKETMTAGDHLRATIENKHLKASAPCVVTDNMNGTHSVTCEAFWSGTSSINVTLAYTREIIAKIYRIRTQVLATRNIYGLFKSRTYMEDTTCHPNHTHLHKITNYKELCNFTYMNSGMSFYCGKPKNEHLLCQDWEQVRTHEPYPELQLTRCEESLFKWGQQSLEQTLQVTVGNADKPRLAVEKPLIPCSQYNITKLWQSRRPTGYFYNGKWNFTNCLGFQQVQYVKCLRDIRMYMIGDSTIRAWYASVIKRFECIPTTEKWEKEKWHKMAECYNKKINFKAGWYPHAQPFYTGSAWGDNRYTLYSTSRRLDNIPSNERAVIVIHLYMHFIAFHHSVFKQRLELIRRSIEKLFSRNKQAIVMIKGPHTFTNTPDGSVRLSDYFGFVYNKIMYEVFDGLFDRIVLLNNKDTTIARHEKWNHPPDDIVNYMIDQMLSFTCKS